MVLPLHPQIGALAHLVERNTGSVEVSGSSPLCSTKENKRLKFSRLFFYFKWFLGVSCELELGFVYVGLWQKDVALIDDCGRTREIDMAILLAPLNVKGATVHNDS